MFTRGSRIIIIESTASQKGHPAVGDKAYVNNLHFYPVERFFLFDGFFFQYAKDKEPCRCERKRFIIDAGMDDELKKTLLTKGKSRIFFDRALGYNRITVKDKGFNPYTAYCLTSPVRPLWTRHYTTNNYNRRLLAPMTKIPYGHIAKLLEDPFCISKNFHVFKAWVMSVTPLLFELCFLIKGAGALIDKSIPTRSLSIYHSVENFIRVEANSEYAHLLWDWKSVKQLNYEGRSKIVRGLQELCVIYNFYQENLRATNTARNESRLPNPAFSHFFYLWEKIGLFELLRRLPQNTKFTAMARTQLHLIVQDFLRDVLISPNPFKSVRSKSATEQAPVWGVRRIDQYVKQVEQIKKKSGINSAALNRIYELSSKDLRYRGRMFKF